MTTTRKRPRAVRRSRGPWLWLGLGALAVAALAGFLLLSAPGAGPAETVASQGKVKGDPAASVEVEEWGDFQ
jgi:hypothetical protein